MADDLVDDLARDGPVRVVVAHHPPAADPLVALHGQGRMPQDAGHVCPGASTMRSRPDRNASGGHVIGSMATDRRWRSPDSVSPGKTCPHLKFRSAQTVT